MVRIAAEAMRQTGDTSLAEQTEFEEAAPGDELVHELVSAEARRSPLDIAIWSERGSLTYGELEVRANRLAHALQRLGAGSESLVGIFLPRSLEMVLAALAIWKCGAAFLPLDPDHPPERLRRILAEARPSVLLVAEGAPDPPAGAAIHVVDVHRLSAGSDEDAARPKGRALPENLAYVIYTSGSSGNPKGVMISHRAIANHLCWRRATYPLSRADRFLQKASLGFDIGIWEVFAPLISGARLVLARPSGQRDTAYLVELMVREQITVAHFGPAQLRAILEEPGIERCSSLRQIFCGGEPVSVELCERVSRRLSVRLHHQYGPSEATVDASCWDYRLGEARSYVPLGEPVARTQLHVLDEALRPVAPGQVGELFLGGVALARAYLRRPALTAAAFLPDPFANATTTTNGSRLYRTGDLVRRHEDDTLEFLGRADGQIKLRGYRIELGEIEAAISSFPGLRQAVVAVRDEDEGNRRLIAYLVMAREARPPGIRQLREFLEARLPEYMIPAVFVELEALPLTPNGKVDRRALPDPATLRRLRLDAGEPCEAPQSPDEARLAELWGEILGVALPGRDAHFLELGGDSILAVQLSARIRAAGYACTPGHVFAHPTVAELARALGAPAAAPRAALQGPEPRALGEVEDIYPLSPMQLGLLYHDLLTPRSRIYWEQIQVDLEGPLDVDRLERAWQRVVMRHPALRTVFRWEGLAEPCQIVLRDAFAPMAHCDLSGMRPEHLAELLCADRERAFALDKTPPLRVTLFRLDEERHTLLWTVHHLLMDGWSADIVLREMLDAYTSIARDRLSETPRRPYRDFIDWIRSQDASAEAGFWRRSLGEPISPTRVFSAPPKALAAPMGDPDGVLSVRWSAAESERLRAFASRKRITLATVLAGAWALLLARYSGDTSVLFGLTVSGRSIPLDGVESMVGLLINTLVLRVDAPRETRFALWLEALQSKLTGLLAHEQAPLAEVQRHGGAEPGAALFDSLLVVENYPVASIRRSVEGAPLRVERRFTPARSPYALTLTVRSGTSLELGARYARASSRDGAVSRLLGQLGQILRAFCEAGDRGGEGMKLCDLPWLTDADRRELAVRAAGPRIPLPEPALVPQLFEAQAARSPDAIAASFEGQELSYRELDARANRLAHLLVRRGIGPERRVGLLLSRSMELLVALLAVLKAGGAYVPLDPDFPAERIAYMLSDAGASVVLAEASLRARLNARSAEVIVLDELRAPMAEMPTRAPQRALHPENLAYLLYTSGSTGRPKGVMVSHGALVNFLEAMRDAPGLSADDVLVALTSLSFDIAGLELLLPLVVGARVVIAPRAWQLDGAELAAGLARADATVLQATPTTWQMLLNAGLPRELQLRALCGGEALPPKLADALMQATQSAWNMYGPTETTIWSIAGQLRPSGPEGALDASISLGEPIGNTQIHVLDPAGHPVPVGVAGELYIGGAGLARGYLGRPSLTAERFVPDPFGNVPGARLYRTGDLVRWREDGGLEFLGRLDLQLKIRGVRIEPGEIEVILAQHPSVDRALVTVHARAPDDLRLVAYVTPAPDKPRPEPDELRRHSASLLPAPMVPSAFVVVDRFPCTPNGKTDRSALPRPDWSASTSSSAERVPPRTPTEGALTEIWRELVGVSPARMSDDFFALGGHSLLLIRLAARVQAVFGLRLPLQAILEVPTLEGMAAAIDDARVGRRPDEASTERKLATLCELPPEIRPTASLPDASPSAEILLTGATGFVGAFLLRELLGRLPARIHCLVRASGRAEAFERIQHRLEAYGLWDPRWQHRIEPLVGDLVSPWLGLSPRQFGALSEQLDAIYHCGAEVNFLYPYQAIENANVLGTRSILELAAQARPKAIHYISTLSVFPPKVLCEEVLCEEDPLLESRGFRTGYAQSKWVAEKLIAEARARGFRASVYRLGVVSGASATGVWNANSFVCRTLKSYIQLGSMPRLGGMLDFIPVDFTAKAIVHLSLASESSGKVFHLANPRPAPAGALHGWLEALGHRLRELPYSEWFEELRRDAGGSSENALYALIPFLDRRSEATHGLEPIHPFAIGHRVDCRNTWEGLRGSGVVCPPVDEALFRTTFEYFTRTGALPGSGRRTGAQE